MTRRLPAVFTCAFALLLLVAAPGGWTDGQVSGAQIDGTVVDGGLSPLAGVAIALEQQTRVVARVTSDADGRFTFQNVAPGDYRVRATYRNLPALERGLRVPAGASTLKLPLVMATQPAADDQAEEARKMNVTPAPPAAPPPAQASVGRVAGAAGGRGGLESRSRDAWAMTGMSGSLVQAQPYLETGDRYSPIRPNRFRSTLEQPLSTFGADVDTASYANIRRFLSSGQLPPQDAVRVEELLNYFHPDYAQPRNGQPIGLTVEVGPCAWAPTHQLVLIGAKARTASPRLHEGRSIVLLLDVSGSMAPDDRLPLIKTALGLFVDTLNPDDRLAIVTYSGSSGVALPSTPVRRRDVIQNAIARLRAGGSTNGAQGIVTAYRIAREAFIPGGINRVMLATDGDFNVGMTSQNDLVRLIERERESGVFLSIFGVGRGNLNDASLEKIANKGNGHYVYLDSLQEARRVLLRETDATLETVAKDVKFQVEFNPATVAAWKLIGYEDRLMADRDFNDDRKDGGEMGAGHTVTVLYEIVPVGAERDDPGFGDGRPAVDPLKYQSNPDVVVERQRPVIDRSNGELLTVKARFKAPEGDVSDMISQAVRGNTRVRHLPFAAAVAEFGLMLRHGSTDVGRWDGLARRVDALNVSTSLWADKAGFTELVQTARGLVRLHRR